MAVDPTFLTAKKAETDRMAYNDIEFFNTLIDIRRQDRDPHGLAFFDVFDDLVGVVLFAIPSAHMNSTG